jgi:DNA repair protein RecN (Recombination protein N)
MLRSLRIQNIILIEEAELEFELGFTVLTGETGAGKSAILKALGLVLGERADSRLIRKGAAKARVEALFEIGDLCGVADLLEEAGIDCEEEELVVRRELTAAGKSRAYINNTLAQTSLVKKLGDLLLDLVGQHANLRLASPEYQCDVLDLYGGLLEQRADFAQQWQKLCQQERELASLVEGEAERLRTLGRLQAEVDELTSAAIKQDEEEELFAEYSRLNHSEELMGTLDQVTTALDEQAPQLQQLQGILNKAAALDASLRPQVEALKSHALELHEVSHELQAYRSRLDLDPSRLAQVNDRLALLNGLQKKYSDPAAYLADAISRLADLESADLRIEDLQKEVAALSNVCDEAAKTLTAARRKAAEKLEKELVKHLRPLNMEGARFDIQITFLGRTARGDDAVEFLFAPNVGEGSVPVRQCASGGELSRLLLALKTALAGLELTPTLVFDEIDANIGGQTGTLVGQKLRSIAENRQVLCITHLPQVAREADHHFHICKQATGGRTHSTVTLLDTQTREDELTRMVGLSV